MDRVPQCRLLMPFQEGTHHKLLRNLISACKVANWIILDILLCYHWQILSISFLLEMVIAKGYIYPSLQYFTQFDSSLSFKLDVLTT